MCKAITLMFDNHVATGDSADFHQSVADPAELTQQAILELAVRCDFDRPIALCHDVDRLDAVLPFKPLQHQLNIEFAARCWWGRFE